MDMRRRSIWRTATVHGLWRTLIVDGVMAMSGIFALAQTVLAQPAVAVHRAEISVGTDQGDIRGADNRALQAAVDHLATLGGGTVRVGPGRYVMRNALSLRDGVDVLGVPGKTVLAACDGFKSPLSADGDCYERQITVTDPSGFRVGNGVSIHDKSAAAGFEVTTATLIAGRPPTLSAFPPLCTWTTWYPAAPWPRSPSRSWAAGM